MKRWNSKKIRIFLIHPADEVGSDLLKYFVMAWYQIVLIKWLI